MSAGKIGFKTEEWQVRYLFELGSKSWAVHISVVMLTGFLLGAALPGAWWPYAWTGVMLVLSLGLITLARRHAGEAGSSGGALRRAALAHTALTTLVGLTWAAGALALARQPFEILAIYSLALGGTALGAVSSQHALPRSCFSSIWSSVPFLAVAHYLHAAGSSGVPVALMMLLYALVLSILAVRMYRFLAVNQALTRSLDSKVRELTDTSEQLVVARKQAEEANLSKSRFLAQASHDLRQPVHAIGLLTASLKDTRLNSEQRQMVVTIERSIDSVMNLFGALLDISRLEIGGIVPKPGSVDLGGLMERLVEQNVELAQKSGCTFVVVPSSQWVETDGNLLFTILQNVVSNALKYAPGSRILIGPRRREGRLAVQICDTGPGIDGTCLDAVFDEFFRLDTGQTATVEGMGLGLSIVKRLTKLLDLDVTLSSVPGRGTSILLSGLRETAARPSGGRRMTYTHPLAGKKVCLIDDDDSVRVATSRLLERWGCQVMPFAGLNELCGDYDAVVADLQLGEEGDGLIAIERLQIMAGRKIPAVILTGHTDEGTARQISEAGVPVLHKPVRPVELRAMLTRLCLGMETSEIRGTDAAG